jgi:hypothetical protein
MRIYAVLTGEYEPQIHRVFDTLEKATKEYTRLKKNFIAEYSDLKHYENIERVQAQCDLEFHLKTYFVE